MKLVYQIIFLLLPYNCFTQFDAAAKSAATQYAALEVSKMSLEDKIGQLFMIRAHSDLGPAHIKEVERQIRKYKVGGLCFFQGTPQKQAELVQKYQNLSQRPLLVAMDAEWGLGMRFKDKDAISFPKNMTLGAIQDNNLIFEMSEEIAHHLKQVGVQINFAPVVDVNNNPSNPVIHNRSFGEDIYNVATKAYAFTKGHQDNGILACAKHFPGHGDTNVDSHYDLPVINHDMQRLENVELMPFRVLSQLGVASVMTAHLQVPAIDDRLNRPMSLSDLAIKNILLDKFNFEGLIFTDGLEMKGVAKHFEPGEMEVEAIHAGNDVLLLPINIDKAFNALKAAINKGDLLLSEIDQKVAKILKYKYLAGLQYKPILPAISGIEKVVKRKSALALKSKLYEKALTLVKDDKNIIPLKNYHNKKIACLSIGSKSLTEFQKTISKFTSARHFNIGKNISESQKQKLLTDIAPYDIVLVGLHDMNIYASKDYGLGPDIFNLLYGLNSQNQTILSIFGTPYSLKFLNSISTIFVAYENDPMMQSTVAQACFGVNGIEGLLPVSVLPHFELSTGIQRSSFMNLGFAFPEEVGINSDSLLLIDTIVQTMIDTKAAPGCQILAAKDGKIFFNKTYGYHTYDKNKKVEKDDIYDVASVTKILSTTLGIMKLYEENKINIHSPVKTYMPEIDTCNKADLIVEDLLAHHAGMPAWIPFYRNTVEEKNKKTKVLEKYYRSTPSDSFNIEVAKNIYLRFDFPDSIYQRIYSCELREKRDYRYSDLGFYLFKDIIERMSKLDFDEYLRIHFYEPMGLKKTLFNPHREKQNYSIVPSEDDDYYRNQVINGYVHDMGAAMLGGVSGHAGLFSNSHELAILMQMLLNGGTYNGLRFLKPETIQKFTTRYHRSKRRGLGFDMKELDPDKKLNVSEEVSNSAFGHLGFTGISVFADPEYNLIYIFISNRTYPTMNNRKFGKENYRPRIQSVFYNAMMKEN